MAVVAVVACAYAGGCAELSDAPARVEVLTLGSPDGPWWTVSRAEAGNHQSLQHEQPGRAEDPQIWDVAARVVREVPGGAYRSDRARDYCVTVELAGRKYVYLLTRTSQGDDAPALVRALARMVECSEPARRERYEIAATQVESKLRREVPEWSRVEELGWVLRFLQEYADVRIRVAWRDLEQIGIKPNTEVRFRCKETSTRRMIDGILKELTDRFHGPLSYELRNDGIFISTAPKLDWRRPYGQRHDDSGHPEEIRFRIMHASFPMPGLCAILSPSGRRWIEEVSEDAVGFRTFSRDFLDWPKFTGAQWTGAKAMAEGIPSGIYRSPDAADTSIEVQGKDDIRTYVFTNTKGASPMPDRLEKLYYLVMGAGWPKW
jgi:hypothetical protein